MNTTPPLPLARSPARALGVFAIFVIGGPLIAVILAFGILPFFGSSFVPQSVEDLIDAIPKLTAGSYFFGGLQAVAIGLAAASWVFVLRRPRVSLLLVALLSLVVATIFIVIAARPFSMPALNPAIVLSVLTLHVGPAIGCGLIANIWLRVTESGSLAVAP
jgi:hypothetical protein